MTQQLNEQVLRKCRQAYAETQTNRERLLMEGAKNLPSPTEAAIRCFLEEAGLLEALEEIAEGCILRCHLHPDAHRRRTKAQIETVARAAIAKATGKAA